MTAVRLLPIQVHSALEMLVGLTLMVVPFALGLSAAAIVTGILVGGLIAGTAMQALDTDGRPLPISAHHAADHGFAIGLAGSAIVLSTVDGTAALLFGAAAIAQLTLNLLTRYSQR